MSSKKPSIFEEKFESYPDALYKYLSFKGLELVWLAEKITPKSKKVVSTQQKFSNWKKEGTKPKKTTRDEIDAILGISIDQNANGEWIVSRTTPAESEKETLTNKKVTDYSADELSKEAIRRLKSGDFSGNAEDLLLKVVLEIVEDLQLTLRQLIQIRKDPD